MRRAVSHVSVVAFVTVASLSLATFVRPTIGLNVGGFGLSVYRGGLWAFGPWGPGLLHLPVWVVLAWVGTVGLIARAGRPVGAGRRRGFEVTTTGGPAAAPRPSSPDDPPPAE
ncbi:MAG: hypothetical protein JWO31_3141 [Phycisphaerales bacterium]|nr:hypothetical protein [Phycisphaerales bacterium]